jgi:hypothetical protein
MAVIVVTDLANVLVDGVPSGSVTDVLVNFKNVAGIRGDLLAAIQAWNQAQQQARDAALAQRDAAHAVALAKQAEGLQGQLNAAQATIAAMQAQVDALGGTELGKQMAREARRAELLKNKAAIEADLNTLDGDAPLMDTRKSL